MSIWHRLLPPLVVIFASAVVVSIAAWDGWPATAAASGAVRPARESASSKGAAETHAGERSPVAHCSVEDLPVEPLRAGRKLSAKELTPALIRAADQVLLSQYPPIGSEVPVVAGGITYVGRVETHFNAVGGARRPWGPHRGITLYAPE